MTDRKMPVKVLELNFSEDGYEGFKCGRWANPTLGWMKRIDNPEPGDEQAARKCWLELFPWWNFVDAEGEEIPHTAEGFDSIPVELWNLMLKRGQEAVREVAMPANLDSSSLNGVEAPATA